MSLEDGQLVINAEHDEKSEKKNGGNVLKERHYGSYYRSFNFEKILTNRVFRQNMKMVSWSW